MYLSLVERRGVIKLGILLPLLSRAAKKGFRGIMSTIKL